jgi:hypothetical protein
MYNSGNSPSQLSSKIQIMIQNSQECLLYRDRSLVDMRQLELTFPVTFKTLFVERESTCKKIHNVDKTVMDMALRTFPVKYNKTGSVCIL